MGGEESVAAWRETKRNQIEEDFRLFAAQGIFAVRWFIMADGLNYGMGELAPRKTAKGWTFDPLPAEDSFYSRFVNDFEFVLQVCRNNNLKTLSLTDRFLLVLARESCGRQFRNHQGRKI